MDVCLQSVYEASERTMQCSVVCMCLLNLAECPQCVMVMQDMQKKASKSTHSVRDEWGVTAAAQVDRVRARAEGQCC